MLTQYHIEILFASLGDRFSPRALSAITYANIQQDRLGGQFGHDEFHFDNNAFEKSYAYIEEQRALTVSSLQKNDALSAWSAFGRFLHTAHDFYAHSNYITLWLDLFDYSPRSKAEWAEQALPAPSEVDAVDPGLLNSPDLRSGKTYYPFELLYFWRPARAFALSWLPRDSHAWMNLDSPQQGFQFDYAMQAAIKRTVIEYERTTVGFSDSLCQLFMDK
ncbi:MAG TPA: hypothetical protein VFR47_27555 [Anaerolineales bacterium]|nr:hypothetical protein [Anaerolineales bacterium]